MTTSSVALRSAVLAELFPERAVAAYELRGSANPVMLLPEEAAACETFRAKRLEEFTAGRLCARGALGEFGFSDYAVSRDAGGTPRWPEGIVGSITHTIGFCGAIAGSREHFAGLGIDAEIVSRVTPDVWSQALTHDDIAPIASLTWSERERAAAIIFSAKEAFYKCQACVTGAWLDYSDVSVEVVSEDAGFGTFIVRSATAAGRRVIGDFAARGRYRVADALVFTGIDLSPDDAKEINRPLLRSVS
ncbi:MAG TPA: 4'-phosphopantetheinyl transferase superfamily protein [Candidatus Baltobacteraceae bacterium]|nr:4'-phosphopantetheinyl transferase superfamily protein [Candidatus Baltobacteraceae bacterium]